jgi:hypothetical protein
VTLLYAAGVNPKELQAIAPSLFSAELDLVEASLALATAIHQVFEGDLLALRPGVRKYRVRRDFIVANKVLREDKLASAVELQKTHCSDRI